MAQKRTAEEAVAPTASPKKVGDSQGVLACGSGGHPSPASPARTVGFSLPRLPTTPMQAKKEKKSKKEKKEKKERKRSKSDSEPTSAAASPAPAATPAATPAALVRPFRRIMRGHASPCTQAAFKAEADVRITAPGEVLGCIARRRLRPRLAPPHRPPQSRVRAHPRLQRVPGAPGVAAHGAGL